ncbi:MAG TPA: sigma-70 family RNA polymerase sigma factor [Actinomycetota bacterium]
MVTRVSELRNGAKAPGSYEDLDDRMLVLDFQAGNIEAFGEIHRRYSALARHICNRVLGNLDDADEATQETMLRVYQGLGRFNGRYLLQPWIARIATNVSLDVTRARARRPQTGGESLSQLFDHPDDDEMADPLEAVERMHQHAQVVSVLATLPEHHRDALILREFEGRSHKEIAEALGITPAQAKALIHRAKGSFRSAWDRQTARHGFAALLPILLAPIKIPAALRRFFLSLTESAGSAASQAASTVTASPAVAATASSTAERVTAAAVAVFTAASITVGAVAVNRTVHHAKPAVTPSPPAAISVAPPPVSRPVQALGLQPKEKVKAKHVEKANKAEVAVPVESPTATGSPSPTESPSTSPTDTVSPTHPPIPPAPAWTMAFSSSVPIGSDGFQLIDSTVSGRAGGTVLFSQATRADGIYLEYWGNVDGEHGSTSLWLFVDTPAGAIRLDGNGAVVSKSGTEEKGFTYTFRGTYWLADAPSASPSPTVSPSPEPTTLHDGTFRLKLRFWADGTSLYSVAASFTENEHS